MHAATPREIGRGKLEEGRRDQGGAAGGIDGIRDTSQPGGMGGEEFSASEGQTIDAAPSWLASLFGGQGGGSDGVEQVDRRGGHEQGKGNDDTENTAAEQERDVVASRVAAMVNRGCSDQEIIARLRFVPGGTKLSIFRIRSMRRSLLKVFVTYIASAIKLRDLIRSLNRHLLRWCRCLPSTVVLQRCLAHSCAAFPLDIVSVSVQLSDASFMLLAFPPKSRK